MAISRNEALERLRAYQKMAETHPEEAHMCADSVLLEIVNDNEIAAEFRAIDRHYTRIKDRQTDN